MIIEYIRKVFNKLVNSEKSPQKLTLSFCLGAALAFSPYLGLQTWLVFPLCMYFGLNITVTMAALYLIGNPFTFVPILISDYIVGKKIVSFFQLQPFFTNPSWMDSVISCVKKYLFDLEAILGSHFCLWCFVIGAHIMAFVVFIVLYPIMKFVFTRLLHRNQETADENNYTK